MPLTLSEALSIVESGQWCSLRYFTANTTKGTGGKVIELAKTKIARRQSQQHTPGTKSATAFPEKSKDPNHRYHFTRNMEMQNGDIVTIYPILITHINQQAVL